MNRATASICERLCPGSDTYVIGGTKPGEAWAPENHRGNVKETCVQNLEVPGGFEPPNNGFADRPLRPLGHGTPFGIHIMAHARRQCWAESVKKDSQRFCRRLQIE
jgi:hypothetical protein